MDINDLYKQNYVPYSNEPEVALVQSTEEDWFPGIRIENISYPLSISAQQNALLCCLSEGQVPKKLYTDNPGSTMTAAWEKEFDIGVHSLKRDAPPTHTFTDLKLDNSIDKVQVLDELLDFAVVEESNFPVSALVETEDGFFCGVNVECTSWEMGLCAERIAIAKALTYGSSKLTGLHVHTRDGEFSSPCGACRQVIMEHLPNRQVHLHHADHSKSVHFSNDLLPHSFSSTSLSNK